ncbi:hypothetical protein ABZT27_23295 [Streptomyces sp. NPDC005389]|uniref:hypothetical protein n=1 Tax=Streptomyces sp. NPDC005389 TaxID=3157040 RepID=UPI0033AE75D5
MWLPSNPPSASKVTVIRNRRAGDVEAERAARARVQTAKVALGERGTPWWDQPEPERRTRWNEGLAALDRADAQETPDEE